MPTAEEEVRVGVRLDAEERRMLDELARKRYPEYRRSQSMLIRRLIRDEYERQQEKEQSHGNSRR